MEGSGMLWRFKKWLGRSLAPVDLVAIRWRIQDFPEGYANSGRMRRVGTKVLFGKIIAKNCMKMKEIGSRMRLELPWHPTWIRD